MVVYVYYIHQLKLLQLAAGQLLSGQPVRYGKGRRYGPYITYKITPDGSLSSSQPGGPPCWASPLTNYAKMTRIEVKRGGNGKERGREREGVEGKRGRRGKERG